MKKSLWILGNGTGIPVGIATSNLYPTRNFNEFCKIGYISLSFGAKNMFLDLFKS